MDEKDKLEKEMLKLQQRAKHLELKTQIDKLQAEQSALKEEEVTEPSQSSHPSESANRRRVAEWVDTTLGQQGQQRAVNDKSLNPCTGPRIPHWPKTSK